MRELNACHGSALLNETHDPRKRFDVLVFPDAEIPW
jgi:hypothetical protein